MLVAQDTRQRSHFSGDTCRIFHPTLLIQTLMQGHSCWSLFTCPLTYHPGTPSLIKPLTISYQEGEWGGEGPIHHVNQCVCWWRERGKFINYPEVTCSFKVLCIAVFLLLFLYTEGVVGQKVTATSFQFKEPEQGGLNLTDDVQYWRGQLFSNIKLWLRIPFMVKMRKLM